MSIDFDQLRKYVIEPTLDHIGLNSKSAVQLMLMTAVAESRGEYLHQLGNGPAVGLWQMEPTTHDDCWSNFLVYRKELASKVKDLLMPGMTLSEQMAGNLYYAVAMCRIKYLRDRYPLPLADDIEALAAYHKRVYNSYLGAAKPEETAELYRRYVAWV